MIEPIDRCGGCIVPEGLYVIAGIETHDGVLSRTSKHEDRQTERKMDPLLMAVQT